VEFQRRHILVAVAATVLVTVAVIAGVVLLSGDDDHGDFAAECTDALVFADGTADVYEVDNGEPGEQLDEPSADLIEFGVQAQKDGICVRWTTVGPVRNGTVLSFNANGPFVENYSLSYNFAVELDAGGARVVREPQTSDETQPIELDAEVTHSGATVSAFVPRSEFTIEPFPYERFSFRSTLAFEPGGIRQHADSVPDSTGAQLGYDDGRPCAAPCGDLALNEFGEQPGVVEDTPLHSAGELVQAANEICRAADQRLERLGRPRTVREILRYAHRAWPPLEAAVAEFHSIDPERGVPEPLYPFVAPLENLLEQVHGILELPPQVVRGNAVDLDLAARAMREEAAALGIARCEAMTIPRFVLPRLRPPRVPPDEPPPPGERA